MFFLKVHKGVFFVFSLIFFTALEWFLFGVAASRLWFFNVPSVIVMFSVVILKLIGDGGDLNKSLIRFFVFPIVGKRKEGAGIVLIDFFRLVMYFFFAAMVAWVCIQVFGGR
ncbi:hypothetical protein HA052_26655 [Chromobacterium haemolyticum]|uniref:YggT family protein n=1 Tax=Chromobacterium fluminis TaxID=3044269 RepID=A0ABX0LHV2_9NEIS|nr:hypothetical protein [Chromobacterium haemolyticum]NHR08773.1 hypothetical protein [Chromobacterium haemolyticum]